MMIKTPSFRQDGVFLIQFPLFDNICSILLALLSLPARTLIAAHGLK
jgi:hypothetical protein